VKHLKKWTFGDLIFTDIGRRAIPWTRLLRRESRLDNDLNIDHRARISALLVGAGIAALLTGTFWRPALLVGTLLLALATVLNWTFYKFLARSAGWAVAIAAIPLHWLYFLGAATGFALGHLGTYHTRHNTR
jgi:hypothetical protein